MMNLNIVSWKTLTTVTIPCSYNVLKIGMLTFIDIDVLKQTYVTKVML